jgi:DNA-binding CsgD family transcriptional regulator/tetratricopeptide (TPR) repeat protein
VLKPRGAAFSGAEASSGGPTFVGRHRELETLERLKIRAYDGNPSIAFIEGEAGIGKSTLLSQFVGGISGALVLRAGGDESEMLMSYGLVEQILRGAVGANRARRDELPPSIDAGTDPLAVGSRLVELLGSLQSTCPVVLAIDDLHWADAPSAQALLFALRRLQADQLLGLVTTRPDGLARLGDGWARFSSGDHRCTRLRITGLERPDIAQLARQLGLGGLSKQVVSRISDHTGGNPLHCRALIEELGIEGINRPDSELPAPRALASVVQSRVASLAQPARQLVDAASVLGRRFSLSSAAQVGDLDDRLGALEAAVAVGLLVEEASLGGDEVGFAHPLFQRAVYDHLGPTRRRELHRRAAAVLPGSAALFHRMRAATGPDDQLAADLEAAGWQARREGRLAQAVSWMAGASASSGSVPDEHRRLLDAFETLIFDGDVVGAEAYLGRISELPSSPRQLQLLGHLDLISGRGAKAEERLSAAWSQHDPVRDRSVGPAAAVVLSTYLSLAGRVDEAIVWGERAVAAPCDDEDVRLQARLMLALAYVTAGRATEGFALLADIPEVPAAVTVAQIDALVIRGMCRLFVEDVEAAIGDLAEGCSRRRAGVRFRYDMQSLTFLVDSEYRAGLWDDAARHGEVAVSIAEDSDRFWDLGFVHAHAALVPAARGDWDVARSHLEQAWPWAEGFGIGAAMGFTTTARASLGAARCDPEEVLLATAAIRRLGSTEVLGRPGVYGWRDYEVEALLELARLEEAEAALVELEIATSPGLVSAEVAALRLRGTLLAHRLEEAAAERAFAAAWTKASQLRIPFELARLELADGRRLRSARRLPEAIGRLTMAREHLQRLRARPWVETCERELSLCGSLASRPDPARSFGLTATELVVARLVAKGLPNREVAAELFVSVKAVEFHLGHIFAKLDIRSRRQVAGVLGDFEPAQSLA